MPRAVAHYLLVAILLVWLSSVLYQLMHERGPTYTAMTVVGAVGFLSLLTWLEKRS